jgi:endonuclease G
MPNLRDQLDAVAADDAVRREILRRRPDAAGSLAAPGVAFAAASASPGRRIPFAHELGVLDEPLAEAIVLREGRPTLLVRQGSFEPPQLAQWRSRILPYRAKIDRAIAAVGRVEVGFSAQPYSGSAWMVAPGVAITNRHVAVQFAGRQGRDHVIRSNPGGQRFAPRVDFREEYLDNRPIDVAVARVLYIAGDADDDPDLALLEVTPRLGARLPDPIALFAGRPAPGSVVVTIGYPAADPRGSAADQARLFGGIYDVKRVAPGLVVERLNDGCFTHDCTTLGGSSGSVVLDVETGAAIGLHFAGEYLSANYAVSSSVIADRVRRLRSIGPPQVIDLATVRKPEESRTVQVDELADRAGYDPAFLGAGPLRVPFPRLSAGLRSQVTPVDNAASGADRYRLDYTHYSVVMHASRRMALVTAVNIDGARIERRKRSGKDKWAFDPRIPQSAQIGNELYAGNELDRGHLVRRLDPTWGSQAAEGERDSFFFTNCAPQHAGFNQRLWLELEDYLLDNAATRGFRATVFTGPVFGADDPAYRDVLLPKAFWKVAVMIDDAAGALSGTGYLVSQASLLTDLEFVFGGVRTYQVPIRDIESWSKLTFGALRAHDPLGRIESAPGPRELRSADDIIL